MNVAENKKTETHKTSIPVPYLNGAIEVAKEIDTRFIAKCLLPESLKIKDKVLKSANKKKP